MAKNADPTRNVDIKEGWDGEVPANPELGYYEVGEAVEMLAAEAGTEAAREALEKLGQALRMTFIAGDWEEDEDVAKDRYVPYMELAGVGRTAQEADLDGMGVGPLLAIGALRGTNPWVKTRLGDLAHRMLVRGEMPEAAREDAREAGKVAALAVLELDPKEVTVGARDVLIRAASVAADLEEEHPEVGEQVCAYCEEILEAASDSNRQRPRPWMVEAAQEGLWRLGVREEEGGKLSRKLQQIAARYTAEDTPNAWTETAWKAAKRWAGTVTDRQEKLQLERDCEWGRGKEKVRFALAGDQDGSALRRAIVYGQAIPHLQAGVKVVGNTHEGKARKEELEEAKRELSKYAERVAAGEGMTPIEVPKELREQAERSAEELREKLRGRSLANIAGFLGFGIAAPQKKSFFTKMAEEQGPRLSDFATHTTMDGGYPLRERCGGMSRKEQTCFDGCAEYVVGVGVRACLTAVREEHSEGEAIEEWAAGLCAQSPWVPEGQRESWARGVAAGMRGDWKTSMEMLLPRMEAAIREQNRRRGLGEADLGIRKMLYEEPYRDLMSEEWRFTLWTALYDRHGWNLRNEHCHGKMNDGLYETGECAFAWWLALHFVLNALVVQTPPFHSADHEEVLKAQGKSKGGEENEPAVEE